MCCISVDFEQLGMVWLLNTFNHVPNFCRLLAIGNDLIAVYQVYLTPLKGQNWILTLQQGLHFYHCLSTQSFILVLLVCTFLQVPIQESFHSYRNPCQVQIQEIAKDVELGAIYGPSVCLELNSCFPEFSGCSYFCISFSFNWLRNIGGYNSADKCGLMVFQMPSNLAEKQELEMVPYFNSVS